jgi:hypothetical protein
MLKNVFDDLGAGEDRHIHLPIHPLLARFFSSTAMLSFLFAVAKIIREQRRSIDDGFTLSTLA